jgi:outer membrane lipopolysaccharide assembly protein LptE/RlpB
MNSWSKLFLIAAVSILVACGQHNDRATESMPAASVAMKSVPAPDMARAKMADSTGGGEESLTEVSEPIAADSTVKRYIALRHALTVETEAEKMQAAFDATVAHCELLKCQILSANYNRETPYSPPSASLSVRVTPRSVEIFLSGLAKNVEVLQHRQDSEDKTDAVIDAEARIKNLTEFRDSLRAMLTDKSAKFKDLIEVQRELVDTQSQLDTIQGVRKVLAKETELVAVNIDFTAKQGITEQGFFSPVAHALKEAGHVMMESLAAVITFFVTILPWLLFGIPMLILAGKLWTKVKARWQSK